MAHRLFTLATLVAVAIIMAACASKVPIRSRGAFGGAQGGSWELVVPGSEVALALAARPSAEHPGYTTRRNHTLGATTPSWAPVAATGAAPTTIARQQSVYLRRSYDSFLYFTSPGAWPADRSWWAQPPPPHWRQPPPRFWDP